MKTNKLTYLTLLFTMTTLLAGCADGSSQTSGTVSSTKNEAVVMSAETGDVKDDAADMPDIEITVPTYLYGTETEGFTKITESEESITYRLTQKQQQETAGQLKTQIQDSIGQVLNGKDYYPNITSIDVTGDCSRFDVTFSGTELNVYETTLRMSLYIAGDKYQLYQGIPKEEILTVVNYIDGSTGEIFSAGDSGSVR